MKLRLALAALAAAALLVTLTAPVAVAAPPEPVASATYLITGASGLADRNAVARTGAAIDSVEAAGLYVTATPAEIRQITALGYRARPVSTALGFPAADAAYHDYAELTAVVNQVVAAYPALARKISIGRSFEGRDLMAVKISDNVATDESEPEILITASQHAREHLTVEMAIYLLNLLTGSYGTDSRVTGVVNGREIWIVPILNPDGAEYDIATGAYRSWRKNRQPNAGSANVGTDLNRNWGYNWGCCGGSSGSTSSSTYRGPSAFSAPETAAVRDFVAGRVVGGVQQIKENIDFHTYGELILWPYGYTTANTAPGLNADQQQTFATIGQQMAALNGYTPEQASDLYITDGDLPDWLWGVHGIWSYTLEMYPTGAGGGGFYPPDEIITRETTRNRDAFLLFAEYADCPYRAIGKQAQYCGTGGGTTVYQDTFETETGWAANPAGTDTATAGVWERADPADTASGGAKQLGTTVSGSTDLVTGPLAGTDAGSNDVDGGVTSIRSPAIALPTGGALTLRLSWYLAHGTNATSADLFRVSVVHPGGTTALISQTGAASNRNGAWTAGTADLTPYAGQSVRLLVEAADAGTASLIEAAIDDITITRP